jgi:predicted pyridoxine 5'-phosphate oxidase superfamily flavin-nucleotide-binding protein
MRRRFVVAVIATVLAVSGVVAITSANRGDEASILRVLHSGQRALLAGDGRGVCALLTAHGRRRALGFQVDYAPEGTPVPTRRPGVPHTCEEIVRREWRDGHQPASGSSWTRELRRARFSIVWVRGSGAKATLKLPEPYGASIKLWLRKTPTGWRVDDSNVVPVGY